MDKPVNQHSNPEGPRGTATRDVLRAAILERAQGAAALRLALHQSLMQEGYSDTFAAYAALGIPDEQLIETLVESKERLAAVQSTQPQPASRDGAEGGQ